MAEIVVLVAVVVVMGAVVGLSLWRFEKKRAEAAIADNAQLRLELAQIKVEHNSALQALADARTQLSEAQQTVARLQQQLQDQAGRLGELEAVNVQLEAANNELAHLRSQLDEARQANATLSTRLAEQAQQYEDKLKLLDEARAQLKQEFENLANRLFEHKQQQFTQHSKAQIESLLKPWQGQLEQFRKRVDELHTQQTQQLGQLQGELSQLKQLNATLAEEAKALTQALKSDSKVQGNWGELVLERLLEAAGLREGEEYVREASFATDEGRQRPDVLIRLPESKHIVIDAKVSLSDYVTAINAPDPAIRQQAAKAHLASVRRHIETLGKKRYHHLDIQAPAFTLMFMPVEGAYLLALEQDPELQAFAYAHEVAIVTPPTLLVTLKTVSHLWKLAHQDRRVLELIEEAGKLHDKFADFIKDFQSVRQRLDQALKAWEAAENKLTAGQGNLVRRVHSLGALSGKVKKALPENLVSRASLEDSNK